MCVCARLTCQIIPSAVGVSLASVPPVTIALLWLPPASRSVSYPWRVGAGLKPPQKNPRSKLKFSNTENGDVCRCVCLWWFRTKFHISGCKCLCQCLCTRVCVRICTVGSDENKAVQLSAVQWFWFGWPFGFSLSQRAQQSHRTLATTSSLAKTEGLTWKRRMRHSGKEGRERKKGSGSKWENERGSVAVRN